MFLFILLTLTVQAQHPFIDEFKVEQVAGGVFISWTLKQGSICQGIQIERRMGSSLDYIEIGEIKGVCGNVAEPVSFTFVDSQAESGSLNHYRLVLGFDGFTEEKSLFVHDFDRKEYVLLQGMDDTQIHLLPRRSGNGERAYHIFDLNGKTLEEGEVISSVETKIYLAGREKGVYILQVTEAGLMVFSQSFLIRTNN